VSGLWAADKIVGDIPDALAGSNARWGNTTVRATMEGRWSAVRARLTAGSSRYDADITQVEPDSTILAEFPDIGRAASVENILHTDQVDLTLDRYADDAALSAWRAGLRYRATELGYAGPSPVPYPAGADDGAITYDSRVRQTTAWYEHRIAPVDGLDLRGALQADVRAVRSAGSSAYLSPRVTGAYALGPDARVSFGLGRHYQFEQALAGVGFDLGPRLVPSHVWVQSDGELQPVRSDIGSVGGEIWLGPGFLLSVTGYVRLSSGTLVAAPGPNYVRAGGLLGDAGLDPAWASADGVARGIDLSARRLAGRITGSVAYSFAKAELKADGRTFPAPGDRRHAVDATLFLRLAGWLRVGSAFTGATGAPYTRFFPLVCPEDPNCPGDEAGPDAPAIVGYAGSSFAQRAPSHLSVDLMMELEGDLMGLKLGGFLQVKNISYNRNDATYLGTDLSCLGPSVDGVCQAPVQLLDRFEVGWPPIPLIGFWARF